MRLPRITPTRALMIVAVVLVVQIVAGFFTPPRALRLKAPAPEPVQAITAAEVHRQIESALDQRGLSDKGLARKINQAIIAFIRSRAGAPGHASGQGQAGGGGGHNRPIDVKPLKPADDAITGNVHARYQLIVYDDYECPFCKRFDPTVKALIHRYHGQLAIGERAFPLSIHGHAAVTEARAAKCVLALGGNQAFWPFSHALFAHTASNGEGLPAGALGKLVKAAGIKSKDFRDCLASPAAAKQVSADARSGERAGVRGTPTTFVYDTRSGKAAAIRGAQPLSAMTSTLDRLLKPAGHASASAR